MTQQLPHNYEDMAEFFSDTFEVQVSPWSSSLSFGVRPTREGEPIQFLVRIRMPVSQLKILGIIALRTVRQLEDKNNALVDLPKEVLSILGIAPEDWK